MNFRRCYFTIDTGTTKSVINSNVLNKETTRSKESMTDIIDEFILDLDIMVAFGFIVNDGI